MLRPIPRIGPELRNMVKVAKVFGQMCREQT